MALKADDLPDNAVVLCAAERVRVSVATHLVAPYSKRRHEWLPFPPPQLSISFGVIACRRLEKDLDEPRLVKTGETVEWQISASEPTATYALRALGLVREVHLDREFTATVPMQRTCAIVRPRFDPRQAVGDWPQTIFQTRVNVAKLSKRLQALRYVRDIGGRLFYQHEGNWHLVYSRGFPEVVGRLAGRRAPPLLSAFFCDGKPLPEEAALYEEYLVGLDMGIAEGKVLA